MKFPLRMTAGLAGYIIRNKMRPRPEWQKDAAGESAGANPFRILPPDSPQVILAWRHRLPHGFAGAASIFNSR